MNEEFLGKMGEELIITPVNRRESVSEEEIETFRSEEVQRTPRERHEGRHEHRSGQRERLYEDSMTEEVIDGGRGREFKGKSLERGPKSETLVSREYTKDHYSHGSGAAVGLGITALIIAIAALVVGIISLVKHRTDESSDSVKQTPLRDPSSEQVQEETVEVDETETETELLK